jgi:hypothetical protein
LLGKQPSKIFTYKKQPTKFDIFSERYFEPWYHKIAIFVIVHLSTQIYQKTYQNFTICCITLFQIVHINYARQMNSDQLLLHMNKKLLTIDYLHDHVRPCIQVGMQNVKLSFLSVQSSTQPSKHQACAWYLYCMWLNLWKRHHRIVVLNIDQPTSHHPDCISDTHFATSHQISPVWSLWTEGMHGKSISTGGGGGGSLDIPAFFICNFEK